MVHDGLEWGELGGEEEMVCEKKRKGEGKCRGEGRRRMMKGTIRNEEEEKMGNSPSH